MFIRVYDKNLNLIHFLDLYQIIGIETCKNLNNILKECSNNRKWTKFTRTFKQTKWSTIRSNIPPVTNNYRIAYRISQLHENKYRPYLTRSMLTVQVNYILEMYIYTYIYIHISLACVQMEARLHASTTLKVRRLRFRGGMHASRNLHPAHHFQCFFVSRSSLRHPLGESERPSIIDQAMNRRGRAR